MSVPQAELSSALRAQIFENSVVPHSGLEAATTQAKPRAIILAGQPGAGKGGLADTANLQLRGDAVLVDLDNLRDLHPDIKALRRAHPYTWSTDTHPFAKAWTDDLLEATVAGRKNLIFDTTLSNGEWASDFIED